MNKNRFKPIFDRYLLIEHKQVNNPDLDPVFTDPDSNIFYPFGKNFENIRLDN